MKRRTFHHQHGIALGPILFIIAILAILAAAIAAGTGSFTANTSAEQAKSNAEALVQYADQLNMAVQKVMADNSCSDTQLQFQAANSNAPSDGSCNIFDPRGGGIVDMSFTNLAGAFDMTKATNNGNWWGTFGHFSQEYHNPILGYGSSSNAQLLFQVDDISLATCMAINKIVGYNLSGNYFPPTPNWWVSNGYFTGTYTASGVVDLGFTSYRVQQGCAFNGPWGIYIYLGVLLAR